MLEIKPTRLNGHGLSRSNSSLRLRPRREPTKVLDPHANAGNHATVIHPMDAARNHGFSGAHRVPGAGSHNRLPCLDPDGWLVRTLQTNSNENPAAELNTRAVNSLSSKIGELPLPRAELYPLTRSLLMGGTYSQRLFYSHVFWQHLFRTYSPLRYGLRRLLQTPLSEILV